MKENTHGGNIYKFSRQQQIDTNTIIDFSANINPLGMSPVGEAALMKAFAGLIHYPDPEAVALKASLAKKYSFTSKQIVLGNGAAEIIYALCRLEEVKEVLITGPAFSEYAKAAEAAHKPIQTILTSEKEQFAVKGESLLSSLGKGTLLFLGNPNNPDGHLLPLGEGLSIIKKAKESGAYVVMDESFIDFTDESTSYRDYIKDYDHLIILHSLTKFYAVPGLRVGVAYMDESVATLVGKQIPAWSLNHLAQVYAVAALSDEMYIANTKAYIAEELERLYAMYQALPSLKVIKPSVNFMLLKLDQAHKELGALQSYLAEKQILIRSCEAYDGLGQGWFRIAIKKKEENDLLYSYVKRFLEDE